MVWRSWLRTSSKIHRPDIPAAAVLRRRYTVPSVESEPGQLVANLPRLFTKTIFLFVYACPRLKLPQSLI